MARKHDEIRARVLAAQRERREKRKRIVRYPTDLPKAERVLDLVNDKSIAWYALLVSPQKEYAAQEILARKGIVTYCPSDHRWRRRNKFTVEKELVSFPLVPGYIFAGMPVGAEPWHDVFGIRIIRACIGFEGRPHRLNATMFAKLVRRFRNGFVRPDEEKYMTSNREFKVGDIVRLTQGPFRSFEVPVIEIKGSVARVMMDLFGTQHIVSADVESLEPAA